MEDYYSYNFNSVTPLLILFMMLFGHGSSDTNQDKAECATQLVGLATCLPYVGGDSKRGPTIDCCSGLKQVLEKSKKCLCVLIRDRNDPTLGLKINATLAATLPSACHSPVHISECISLLHLTPNSTDAKLFEGFAKITDNAPPAVQGNSTGKVSAKQKSDGGEINRWLGVHVIYVVLLWFLLQ